MSCPKCGSGNIAKKKQCVDGLVIMCAAIADTTTLKDAFESVVKNKFVKINKEREGNEKLIYLFIYENNVNQYSN